MQKMHDSIHVVIVDDCSTTDYSNLISSFDKMLDIDYIRLQNNIGSGKARQIGIENSTSKYVCFVDSDDSFYNEYSVWMLYEKISKLKCEFVTGSFIREFEPNDDSQYPLSKIPQNQTWVFGRMFLRDFLVDKHICFNNMRFNEDVSFMQLCFAQSTNNEFIKNTVYVQHCNMDSITRSKDSEFKKNALGIIKFIDALTYSHKKKRQLGIVNTDKSITQMCDGLAVCYWYFIQCLNENSSSECELFLNHLQEYYNLIIEDFKDIKYSDHLKSSYFSSMYSMVEVSNKYVPKIMFYDLLDDLEENRNTLKDISGYGYETG